MSSDESRTGADLIKRPSQRKTPRPYSPGREGFLDVMQELMFQKLTVPFIENDVTDFPDPESPTIPRTSPLYILNETSSTALTVPASVWK